MRILMVLLAGLTLACGSATRLDPSPLPASTGPVMPDSLLNYRLVGRRILGGRDSLWRYTDGRAQVSVIRYVIDQDVQVGTDSVAWLEREGQKFLRVQAILREQGRIDRFEVRMSKLEQGPKPPEHEHIAVVTNTSRGKQTVEMQYLYLVGGRWLKVRVTEPDDGATSSSAPLFARSLARRVARMTERPR